MACDECVQRLPFLRAYQIHITHSESIGGEVVVDEATSGSEGAAAKPEPVRCGLNHRKKLMDSSDSVGGPAYFNDGWRSQLCCCTECKVSGNLDQ